MSSLIYKSALLRFSTATILWAMVFWALGFWEFFWMAFAEDSDIGLGTYEAYKQSIDKVCYASVDSPDGAAPWNVPVWDGSEDLPPTLLSASRFDYPDIYDKNADQKFKDGMASIKGKSDELYALLAYEAENLPIASQIEKASSLYKERMNSIYACAVLNAKYKIHTRLINEFRPQGSNIVRRLEQASTQIEQRLKEKGCRNVSKEEGEGSELTLKRSLIADATRDYCNYRHYLSYVDYNVKNRLGDVIQAEQKLSKSVNTGAVNDKNKPLERYPNTEVIARALSSVSGRVTSEILRTQTVFDSAFDAYRDFERHYASHIIMVLIEDRYQLIRTYMRDTMNPIWQVIYQASNATSTGK